MFYHCQPMRNHHTEQLQGGNGKMNSEKVAGQSSSIHLVSPYIISPWVCRGSTPLAVLCVAGQWAEVGWNRGRLSVLNVRILTVRGGGTLLSDGSWCYHYQLHTSGSPSHCAPLCYYPWCGGACRDLGQCKGKLRRNSGFMLQLLHT